MRISPVSGVHEPHRLRWVSDQRTDLGRGRPNRSGQHRRSVGDVDVLGPVAALEPLDQLGHVDGLVGPAHAGRDVDADHPVDHDGLDRLASTMRADHLDRHGHGVQTGTPVRRSASPSDLGRDGGEELVVEQLDPIAELDAGAVVVEPPGAEVGEPFEGQAGVAFEDVHEPAVGDDEDLAVGEGPMHRRQPVEGAGEEAVVGFEARRAPMLVEVAGPLLLDLDLGRAPTTRRRRARGATAR